MTTEGRVRETAMETGVGSAVERMKAGRALADLGCALCGRTDSVSMHVGGSPVGPVATCAGCRSVHGAAKAHRLAVDKVFLAGAKLK
jgi:hypothetical protein